MIITCLRGIACALGAAILAASLFVPTGHAQAQVKQKTPVAKAAAGKTVLHRVAIQVSQNDKGQMDLALNNAGNVIEYYKEKGEKVEIEIIAYGPGLHMLRADTSPVKHRIGPMALEHSNLKFIACENTRKNQSKAESKDVTLIGEAQSVASGVIRLMELQSQGYAYIRP